MSDAIMNGFLDTQLQDGLKLAANSDVLKLMPLRPKRPQQYIAEFACRGLVRERGGRVVEFDKFVVGINFPDDYLRRVHVAEVLTYLGLHPRPWHPNIRPPHLCLNISPGTSLVDLLYGCYELFTWNKFNIGHDGFVPEAAQWARQQPRQRFPIDRRPLRHRPVKPAGAAGAEVA